MVEIIINIKYNLWTNPQLIDNFCEWKVHENISQDNWDSKI